MPSYWPQLALFMGATLCAALYGLAASGHFPAEHRPDRLRRGWGAVALWTSMIVAVLATGMALARAWASLPWYAAVIGGGAALLFAPLLLRPLPDSFVDGPRALLAFGAGAAMLAAGLWAAG